jgi:hypothetical protein
MSEAIYQKIRGHYSSEKKLCSFPEFGSAAERMIPVGENVCLLKYIIKTT